MYLTRDLGYRYSEIGVICANLPEYSELIKKYFFQIIICRALSTIKKGRTVAPNYAFRAWRTGYLH
ncbi:MAG: hypothetical protein L6V93_07540 [Clostridiales bacterium]|nr:MAG: hypothetical protein L6V93_07540 [Clostridiales bacterium]